MILGVSAFFSDSNYAEACLWCAISLGFGWAAWRATGEVRGDSIVASVTFLFFGFSDVVEAHTGAWWRPWWLLVWKGACLAVMLVLFLRYRARRAQVPRE